MGNQIKKITEYDQVDNIEEINSIFHVDKDGQETRLNKSDIKSKTEWEVINGYYFKDSDSGMVNMNLKPFGLNNEQLANSMLHVICELKPYIPMPMSLIDIESESYDLIHFAVPVMPSYPCSKFEIQPIGDGNKIVARLDCYPEYYGGNTSVSAASADFSVSIDISAKIYSDNSDAVFSVRRQDLTEITLDNGSIAYIANYGVDDNPLEDQTEYSIYVGGMYCFDVYSLAEYGTPVISGVEDGNHFFYYGYGTVDDSGHIDYDAPGTALFINEIDWEVMEVRPVIGGDDESRLVDIDIVNAYFQPIKNLNCKNNEAEEKSI
jgi:hypothetical protein